MKKTIGLSLMAVLFTMVACNDQPAAVKKEVIITPAPPVIIVKEQEQKGTTITVGKNGVKVISKKAEVIIKKN